MSARPSLQKKLRRLRKATRVPLPVHFDLVDWLKTRRHAQTTGEAHRLILAGRVRSGSHVIGQQEVPVQGPDGKLTTETVVQRIQPVKFKDELIVLGGFLSALEKFLGLAFRLIDWWRQDRVPPFTIVVDADADTEDYDVIELRRLILEKQAQNHG